MILRPALFAARRWSLARAAYEHDRTRLWLEPRLARAVELHFYGGLSFPEMSRVLQVTERTLFRDWRAARALIHDDLIRSGRANP